MIDPSSHDKIRVQEVPTSDSGRADEIHRLREALKGARLDRANLAAAARATMAALHDHEPDPLAYLREELSAQGFGDPIR